MPAPFILMVWGYYELDSIVEACEEYILALEIMEEHFDEKELVGKKARFMALTYTHLTSKRVAVLLSLSVENEQDGSLCAVARALLYMPPCYVETGRSVCLPSWVTCIYYGAFIAFLTAENQVVA